MKVAALILATAASAAAFAPASQSKAGTALQSSLDDLPGSTMPAKSFDPLGLATAGSEETLNWFKAAELKHSRCAMAAFVGFLVQANGIHFPGQLSSDVSFDDVSKLKPFEAWDAVPDAGKAQILLTILIAEIVTESKGTHYMMGGPLPTIVFPPIDMGANIAADKLKRRQDSELNNGRLAMIGMMSVIAATTTPGSVPFFSKMDVF
uniref:Plastid light harvesting protein n=1 Tax=Cyclophora tenuis TaxID=216820 RepID=A0A7S1D0M2_CYCTE|mmetsp:Transcript_17551/g.29766  ORF Transcript_17551/g.29766 Transcript_17551/m.29766 type:complete len:207 (+) Transcript_17551:66-686(+)|eukprot:CAMPEP_0116556016 /NCGR_PEP_ID=MMETSP0397-20121206/8465_1 /TAXON_ID=216820 /ORGANISM="Cyclophora tenuis, Strain ECT3854" /LENGTH=206 /DNA_ID=CAMNT_0004081345 /DNA_START=45 /DNA_END=665 /DNA_ORIENTATION=+